MKQHVVAVVVRGVMMGVALAAMLASPCHAADRFWVGGASSEWTNTLNWSTSSGGSGGATVPISGDRAWFDGGSTGDCLMNTNGVVDQLILSNSFVRVLDLGTNNLTITYAAGNGRLYVGGGEIRLGTGTLALSGDLYAAGGTITPQSSTVIVYACLTTANPPPLTQVTELVGSCTFNNLQFAATARTTGMLYASITNGNVTVTGTLTFDGGSGAWGYSLLGGGELHARGTITRNYAFTPTGIGGNVKLVIDGSSGDQLQDTLQWSAGDYLVSKSTGTLVCTNTTVFGGGTRLYLFSSPVDFTNNKTRAEIWPTAGATAALAGSVDPNFYDLDIRGEIGTGGGYLDLSNHTVTVNRNCWVKLDSYGGHDRKINNGILDIKGSLTLTNTPSADNRTQGSAVVRMSGPSNATLRSGDAGTNTYFNNIVIAKRDGAAVTLASDLGIQGAAGTNLWVQSGALDLAGFHAKVGALLKVDDTLRLKGGERIYGATTNTLNTNSSTLVFYDAAVAVSMSNFFAKSFYNLTLGAGKTNLFGTGTVDRVTVNGALGSDGSVGNRSVLRSAVDGKPWYLTLAGTSLLTNRVDVKDSDASAGSTVLALGSLDSANNSNWKLVSDDTPIIRNSMATNVTTTSADLVGNLLQGSSPVQVTCYWGTSDGGTNPLNWAASTNLGAFVTTVPITNSIPPGGLVSATTYSYTFYASNSVAGVWANYGSRTFSTFGPPAVNNDGGATAIGQTYATLRGTLAVGDPSTTAWIYWGTSDGSTNKGSWNLPVLAAGQPGLTTFIVATNSLLANQTYWYRCYVSNSYGDAWAPASTNFTTQPPALVINDIGRLEGARGTTNPASFTVTLSALSALPVSVNFAAADNTANAADRDYVATNGTLTIPASTATGLITVAIVGDNKYETDESFCVNLSSPVDVTIADSQGVCAITNDDYAFYVRGDGLGSDTTNFGSAWNDAFASLQKAISTVPASVDNIAGTHGVQNSSIPRVIYVQGSVSTQAYDVVARHINAFDVDLEGGWMNVDSAPAQTGYSVVSDKDGAVDEAGFVLTDWNHGQWRRVVINRLVFTNVTRGVELITNPDYNSADIFLTISNTAIYAQADGVHVSYPVGYSTSYGGHTVLIADTIRVVAGLNNATNAHGVAIYSPWEGTRILATDSDPVTGKPNVSTITSRNGHGIYLCGVNTETDDVGFSNLVVYGCGSNGIMLAANGIIQTRLDHCTIVDNRLDGVRQVGGLNGGWVAATNNIFANNVGAGINLGFSTGVTYTCTENYNVFFLDSVLTNGAERALGTKTSTSDPLFYAQKTKPAPWYLLSTAVSPAYHRASDGANRGAYQSTKIPQGSVCIFE